MINLCAACDHPKVLHPLHPESNLNDGHCFGEDQLCKCTTFIPQANPKIPHGALDAKLLSDGRRCVLYRTIFGARFLIGPADDDFGGDEEYMFDDMKKAIVAIAIWDGYGEPPYWNRHKIADQTRYRREDGTVDIS